jgi:type II secretory pathway component GspD/PulD (secretin)
MKYRLSFIIMALTVAASISGCASIKNIKKNTVSQDSKDMLDKNNEDLNALVPIVKIPISKKIPYFEVGDANVYKSNMNIAVSFNRTPFKTAMRAVAREMNANISFNYENKNQVPRLTTSDMQTITPVYTAGATKTTTNASDEDYTYQLTKDIDSSINSSGKDPRKNVDYFDRMISLEYKGSIKNLFNYLSETTNYFYIFQNNNLIIKSSKTFKIMIPNYPGIMKEVGKSIEKLGASSISYDEVSNNITFSADYPTYKRVLDFTSDIKNNMALITMRVIMLNVSFSGEKNYGIDWSKLVGGWQGQAQSQPFGLPALGGATTATTVTTDLSTVSATVQNGVGAVFNSTGANIFVQGSKFTLAAFMNFISNYGKSSILQNVFVQTMSGKTGKLTSLTETPYVSNVGISSLSSNSVSTQAAATTEKAKSGVELSITPSYTKDEGTLTIALNAGLFGVTRFITLQAGTLGSFTQPITTKKTVEAVLRMAPNQTAIIGGLTFDKKSGSTTGLPGDTYLTNSAQTTTEREELIIIVKPQIFEFVPM